MLSVPVVDPLLLAVKPLELMCTVEPLGNVPILILPLLLPGELLVPPHAAKASAKHNTTRLYMYARARLID